ncbi:hypothetical protein SAMN05216308_12112 [Nitrosospira sp. Nsp13]|nr:hypothetical protein SAMN05216308_12112 [Nitrosospira sp. Nsp13]
MEFSSPQRSLKWAYEPTRRFLQSSGSGTYYLNRPEFVKMVFGLLSLVLRTSRSQIPIAGKFVTTHLRLSNLRFSILTAPSMPVQLRDFHRTPSSKIFRASTLTRQIPERSF